MESKVNLSKESFNSFKEIEFIEDFSNFSVKKGLVVVAYPSIEEKTSAGLIKSDKVKKQEEDEILRKPALVIGISENDEGIEVGKRVYVKDKTNPVKIMYLKNALEEPFICFYVYMSDILSISK